ncbi:hypothetical protein ACHHV8_35155 [Paenibacillus sp. TAB 01]|uniref:hypothetical protein n=1 Tax=Paenibacillus sp. TAB 01 TaxID=3368988 RepID=UPI003753645B
MGKQLNLEDIISQTGIDPERFQQWKQANLGSDAAENREPIDRVSPIFIDLEIA